MSSIKSDSLFSSTKNLQYHSDLKPNESTSSIFRSIFDHIPPKPKSIVIESLFEVHPHPYQAIHPHTLMDRLITAGYKEHPSVSMQSSWAVCKNEGVSEEEDNDESNNQEIFKLKIEQKVKEQPRQVEQNLENRTYIFLPNSCKKIKNETKNIPKNYGKAIISFIEKHKAKIQNIARKLNFDYEVFLADLKKKKKSINTIADLRTLWSNYEYSKLMRIVSCLFLRKFALSYIFDSRICTYTSHIKYRQRLSEAVSSPQEFRHIKDY